jgi:hypothetical protein
MALDREFSGNKPLGWWIIGWRELSSCLHNHLTYLWSEMELYNRLYSPTSRFAPRLKSEAYFSVRSRRYRTAVYNKSIWLVVAAILCSPSAGESFSISSL